MSSLNLLPDEIREDIVLSKKNAKLRQYVFFIIAISIFLMAIFGVLAFYLATRRNEAENLKKFTQKQIEIDRENFQKAKDLSARIALIKKINKEDYDWIKILNELAAKTPKNVQMDSFSVQKLDVNRVKVTGSAITDSDIVAFKENLANSELFSFVDIESITKGRDSKEREVKIYVISFTLKPEKVKNEK